MLEIIYLAVDSLRGYENNSRVHGAEQVDSICKSIAEFGFTNPLLLGIVVLLCRLSLV
jgi:hypothetical protein